MKINMTAGALFLCAIALAPPLADAAEKKVSIATGPAGGVYLPLGKGMADILGKYMPDTLVTHEATSASADNIRMVAAGKVTMAFTQADTAWDGYKGYNKFEAPLPIRALAVVYPNHLHLVTRDSSVAKVSDLKGKRVSTGAAGSGTEIWGLRLLEANLINADKDIVRHKLALKESIAALQEGKIDAFLWASGTPAKAIADYAKEPGANVRIIDTAGAVRSMQRKYGPVYTDGRMPPNTYNGQTRTARVAEVWNLLVVHEKADDKFVYDTLKTLFDRKADLVAVHEQAGSMSLDNQAAGESPIPYHPAAKKFFSDLALKAPAVASQPAKQPVKQSVPTTTAAAPNPVMAATTGTAQSTQQPKCPAGWSVAPNTVHGASYTCYANPPATPLQCAAGTTYYAASGVIGCR